MNQFAGLEGFIGTNKGWEVVRIRNCIWTQGGTAGINFLWFNSFSELMLFVVLLIGHREYFCFHIYVFRNWYGHIYCKMNRNQPQQHGLALELLLWKNWKNTMQILTPSPPRELSFSLMFTKIWKYRDWGASRVLTCWDGLVPMFFIMHLLFLSVLLCPTHKV